MSIINGEMREQEVVAHLWYSFGVCLKILKKYTCPHTRIRPKDTPREP